MLLRFFRALSVGDSAKQMSFDQKQLLVMHLVMLNVGTVAAQCLASSACWQSPFPQISPISSGFSGFPILAIAGLGLKQFESSFCSEQNGGGSYFKAVDHHPLLSKSWQLCLPSCSPAEDCLGVVVISALML